MINAAKTYAAKLILIIIVVFLSFCNKENKKKYGFLKNPEIAKAIELYVKRNEYKKLGLYYIKVCHKETYYQIELSSLIYRTQIDSLQPCGDINIFNKVFLIKDDSCTYNQTTPDLIYDKYKKSIINNKITTIEYDESGDIILPRNILYHPEVLSINVEY